MCLFYSKASCAMCLFFENKSIYGLNWTFAYKNECTKSTVCQLFVINKSYKEMFKMFKNYC